jgi:hypothetical protein
MADRREIPDWRTEPERSPWHSLSDSELQMRASRRPPRHGEIHFFESRGALRRHFRSIPEEERGDLLNASRTARSGEISDRYGSRPSILSAIEQFIGGVFTRSSPPPYTICLCEQEPMLQTLYSGWALTGRSATSSPTPPVPRVVHREGGWALPTPMEHVQSRGSHRRSTGFSALGHGLDVSNSMSISVSERVHHVVVIQQPPPGEGEPGFSVWIRPQVSATRRGEWRMMPVSGALQYLGM